MRFLPSDADLHIAESKITDYLLNDSHPVGAPKAKFFASLGFSSADPAGFTEALKEHGRTRPIVEETPTGFGTKYQIECSLPSPRGSGRCIRSIWIREEGHRLKLVSAYPLPTKR